MNISDIRVILYTIKQILYAVGVFLLSLAVAYSICFTTRDRKVSPPIETSEKMNDISSLTLGRRIIIRKETSDINITCIEPTPIGKTVFISPGKEKFVTTSTPVPPPLQEIGWNLCIAYMNGAITKDQYASSLMNAIDLESSTSKNTDQSKCDDDKKISSDMKLIQIPRGPNGNFLATKKNRPPPMKNNCQSIKPEKHSNLSTTSASQSSP